MVYSEAEAAVQSSEALAVALEAVRLLSPWPYHFCQWHLNKITFKSRCLSLHHSFGLDITLTRLIIRSYHTTTIDKSMLQPRNSCPRVSLTQKRCGFDEKWTWLKIFRARFARDYIYSLINHQNTPTPLLGGWYLAYYSIHRLYKH